MKTNPALYLLALVPLLAPTGAFGEVMHYSKCTINDGKTLADVQAWVDAWRVLKEKEGVDYEVRLLVPHADASLAPGEFFIEGGSSTLESYAKAWSWWYSDPDARASNEQLVAAATCDSGVVYRSND